MAHIFVSYSRKNIDFCKRLTDELEKRGLDFWVDWEGIPPTVDWLKEIEKGVEEADTFLAIVSTDWISSRNCIIELEYAVKNGKRLIPVVAPEPKELKWDDVPADLAQLNFIFFTEKYDFNTALDKLFTAVETDYDWLKTHRRLQMKALEWERSNKEGGFLLHGKDLDEAEQQISVNANKDPHPTDIQREYVLTSRQGATRQRRRTIGILIALVAVMLGIIALLVKPYVEEAIARSDAKSQSQLLPVPAGSITFQVDAGVPVQTANVQKFSIETHAVTNQAYTLCVNVNKCTPPIGSADFAETLKQDDSVVWVSVVQAAVYCQWIGRRLPDAVEWEHAVRTNDFSVSDYYEWTSSYLTNNMQTLSGEWNGQLNTLSLDWPFLQQAAILSSDTDLEIYKNHSGAFGANADLSFRCASK